MSARGFNAPGAIASVDLYFEDESGNWLQPLARGLLLGFDGDHCYVLVGTGEIVRLPLRQVRVVGADEAQPQPPKSPAQFVREVEELHARLKANKRRARRAA